MKAVWALSLPAHYMQPTQDLSFIPLHHYTLLSELKIACLTLCLIRITQPSHTYKRTSHMSTYITWLIYRDDKSVVTIHITRLLIFMSSKKPCCLSTAFVPVILSSLHLIWITHLKASSLTIHGLHYCHHVHDHCNLPLAFKRQASIQSMHYMLLKLEFEYPAFLH